MVLDDVIDHIEDAFQLKCKTKHKDDAVLIKILGIDNCSLARWIRSEFNNVKVYVKNHNGYKFSDEGWVRVCLY